MLPLPLNWYTRNEMFIPDKNVTCNVDSNKNTKYVCVRVCVYVRNSVCVCVCVCVCVSTRELMTEAYMMVWFLRLYLFLVSSAEKMHSAFYNLSPGASVIVCVCVCMCGLLFAALCVGAEVSNE